MLAETLIGAVGALAVLLFVFASFLAFLPLLIAAVSILTTFLIVLGLTTFYDVSFVVQFLISLIGLGVAIDYSLLLVSRWREELAHGHDNEEAVLIAVRTAGHAVLASGVTVAISLLALVVLPVPFLRSMGFGGMLIPLVSVAVVLTLLPVLLASIGPRIDWPRIRHEGVASRGWSAWARPSSGAGSSPPPSRCWRSGCWSLPVSGLKIGQASIDSLATSGPAYDTVQQLRDGGVGSGVLTPIEVLVPDTQAAAAAAAARGVDGICAAVHGGSGHGTTVVDVLPEHETVDSSGTAVVAAVRSAVNGATDGTVGIAGAGRDRRGLLPRRLRQVPLRPALIAAMTFLLLVRTFRSLLLPLKAVVLNLMSLAAVFGVVVVLAGGPRLRGGVRRRGHRCDHVLAARGDLRVPVRALHGLRGVHPGPHARGVRRHGIDPGGGRHRPRAHRAAGHSAALILFFAFAALASAPGTDIKVLGTALGSAS